MVRDGYRSNLPHQSVCDKIISSARETDINIKTNRKLDYNSMQNVKNCNFKIGDEVLVRNYQRTSKYDPLYLPKKFVISDIVAKGNIIIVKDLNSSFYLKRHPNDLKHVNQNITFNENKEILKLKTVKMSYGKMLLTTFPKILITVMKVCIPRFN